MSFKQGLILGVVFLVIALAGSAGISYGVVELSGAEGPRGEQGEQGGRGPKGAKGARGAAGTGSSTFEVESGLFRLAELWAVNEISESGAHPQTIACIDYIMDNIGSFAECGFTRAE